MKPRKKTYLVEIFFFQTFNLNPIKAGKKKSETRERQFAIQVFIMHEK